MQLSIDEPNFSELVLVLRQFSANSQDHFHFCSSRYTRRRRVPFFENATALFCVTGRPFIMAEL